MESFEPSFPCLSTCHGCRLWSAETGQGKELELLDRRIKAQEALGWRSFAPSSTPPAFIKKHKPSVELWSCSKRQQLAVVYGSPLVQLDAEKLVLGGIFLRFCVKDYNKLFHDRFQSNRASQRPTNVNIYNDKQ